MLEMLLAAHAGRLQNYGDENLVICKARVHDLLVSLREDPELNLAVDNHSREATGHIS
jgi:hypothetical protein